MRVCNCVGYLTNPGGVCCMDLWQQPVTKWANPPYYESNYPLPHQPLERDIKLFPLPQFTDEEVLELRKLLSRQEECRADTPRKIISIEIYENQIESLWYLNIDYNEGPSEYELAFDSLEEILNELFRLMEDN